MTAGASRRPRAVHRPDAATEDAARTPARPRCQGCGAAVGGQHDRICNVTRCRATGQQWMLCAVTDESTTVHQPDVWTGRWPGEEDCERLGFLARYTPGEGWIPCTAGEADAQPDFTRLHAEASWDAQRGRWVV